MGLSVSHGAFSGSYGGFNLFRQVICQAVGGSFPPHKDTSLDGETWYFAAGNGKAFWPGLTILLSHSDCDGEISPEDAVLVATDLDKIADTLRAIDESAEWTHRRGWCEGTAKRFADGCREAAEAGEPLQFM